VRAAVIVLAMLALVAIGTAEASISNDQLSQVPGRARPALSAGGAALTLVGIALSAAVYAAVGLWLARGGARESAVLGIGMAVGAGAGIVGGTIRAYLIRDYAAGQPKMGTILVQGTMSTYNTVRLLPKLSALDLNVKLVAAVSPELFRLQPKAYQEKILPSGDRVDITYITNGSRRLMRDWITHSIADEYAMSSDWDNRWRTGGTVDEVLEEAHLSQDWLLRGIQRFVDERSQRLERLGEFGQRIRSLAGE